MSNTTLTTVCTAIVASTTNTGGSTTRGTADLRTSLGGYLLLKITNAATGPTPQCEGRVLVAPTTGSTPTAASAGADWKTLWRFGGGITANAVTESGAIDIPFGTQHVEVEFTGNSSGNVTVEAWLVEVTDAASA